MTKTLVSNSDWSAYQNRPLIVTRFMKVSGVARASVTIEGQDVPAGTTGMIFHKADANHLASAFAEKAKGDDRLVVIEWSTDHLRGIKKLLAPFLPRLTVGVFTVESFELVTRPEFRPELKGVARFNAERPIAIWSPEA